MTQPIPKVRGLVWKHGNGGSIIADSEVGRFMVWPHYKKDGRWFWTIVGDNASATTSEAKGKAASQAEFARRVLDGIDMGGAVQGQVAVPEGWALVPIEPTEEMHEAGEFVPRGIGSCPPSVGNVYRAMIAAAPQPPAAGEPEKTVRPCVCCRVAGPVTIGSCPVCTLKTADAIYEYCGADASRWAATFRLMAAHLGYSDMDEGWLMGWIANAIQRSIDVRCPQPPAATAGEPECDHECELRPDIPYQVLKCDKCGAPMTVVAAPPAAYLAAGESAEPVAWLHTMHMEGSQKSLILTFDSSNAFGSPGQDYSAEYTVTSDALYAHPPAPEPTQPAGDECPRPCNNRPDGFSARACIDAGECGCGAAGDDAELVEHVARWLHDETDHPSSYPSRTWPEHKDDTGQRGNGFVKLVPVDAQAYFREIAARFVRSFISDRIEALTAERASMLKAIRLTETERDRLREALTIIAAFDDLGGNNRLERTGSYGGYDEPGAVKTARAALAEQKGD